MTPDILIYIGSIAVLLLLAFWARGGHKASVARCQAELDQLPSAPQNIQVEINPLIFDIYLDTAQEWRWRAKRSGRIVAEGGEGYEHVEDLCETLSHLFATVAKRSYSIDCKVPGNGFVWGSSNRLTHFKTS